MQRVILHYFAAVALVSGQSYYGSNNSPTPIKRGNSDKVTQPDFPKTVDGCFHKGKWYPRGSEINRGYDGKSWCYGAYCDQSGQVVLWDNFRCSTQHTTTVTTTTPTTFPTMPTTFTPSPTPAGCYYYGKWFPIGSQISRGSTYGWCHGMYCDAQGSIVVWDDWSCSTTLRPTTIPPTTPHPTPQRPLGCIFRGWMYDLGSEISQYTWIGGQKCSGKRCSNDGEIITWLTFSCQSKTDHLQSQRNGCWYQGYLYHRSLEMFRKQSPGRCSEGACEKNGLIHWKSISCKKERQFLAGQRRMCSHRGQLYPRGSIVRTRSLYKSHGFGWCVGTKCGRNGRIVTFGPSWLPGYC